MKASLVAHMVKNLPAVQKTQVWSLRQKDTLEKEMATHSSILAWIIPVMYEYESWTVKKAESWRIDAFKL